MEAITRSTILEAFLAFLCLSFLICRMGVRVRVPTTQAVVRVKLDNELRVGTGWHCLCQNSQSAQVGIL